MVLAHRDLLTPVLTAGQMMAMDRRSIEDIGITGMVLMENAGRECVAVILEMLTEPAATRVVVLCGKGNNGGDGYVIARYLKDYGADVEVVLVGASPDEVKGDAKQHLDIMQKSGLEPEIWSTWYKTADFGHVDLVVDAMLGTGVSGDMRGEIAEAITAVNNSAALVFAVDLPTGLNADTGAVLGDCVRADVTVSMAFPKRAHKLYPGHDYCGDLQIAEIGIAGDVLSVDRTVCFETTQEFVEQQIPQRPATVFKNKCGQALVLAGSTGMTGAATLASQAVLRSGAGMCIVGIPESLNPVLEEKLTEVMTLPLPETGAGSLSFKALEMMQEKLDWADVLALGPGISTHEQTSALVFWLIQHYDKPMIVDADALNCLSENPDLIARSKAPLILTPHPGELARLLKTDSTKILADPIEIAATAAQQFNADIVLKVVPALTATRDGDVVLNATGNPGMATAGMGDVLTGVITGLTALGKTTTDAAIAGVYVHGLAGDLAADAKSRAGLIASDLLDQLPYAFSTFETGNTD